jgi:hypothetical protein
MEGDWPCLHKNVPDNDRNYQRERLLPSKAPRGELARIEIWARLVRIKMNVQQIAEADPLRCMWEHGRVCLEYRCCGAVVGGAA